MKAPMLDQRPGDSSSSKGNSWLGKSCFEGRSRGRAGTISGDTEQREGMAPTGFRKGVKLWRGAR